MPGYTDNPLGAFLQTLGAGIPALAQGHRVRGIQDQQLEAQRQMDALKLQQMETAQAEHPQDRAFEQFTRASQVDPLGSVILQRDKLKAAGIDLPEGYVPPDKVAAIQRQKMIDSIMGGDGPAGGPAAGGAAGPVDARTRIAYKMAFPNMDLTDIFGPANEPTVQVDTVNDQGQAVKKILGRSQAVGKEFPMAPTGAQRTQLAGAENIDAIAGQVQSEFNPDYVGPAAGRMNALKQVIPGFSTDPKIAKFYASTASLLNITMNALSGAAVNEHEAQRILGQVPNQNDKPEVFLAKLQTTRENNQRLQQIILQKQGGMAAPSQAVGGGPPQANAAPQADPRLVKYAQLKGLPLDQVIAAAVSLR